MKKLEQVQELRKDLWRQRAIHKQDLQFQKTAPNIFYPENVEKETILGNKITILSAQIAIIDQILE